MRSILASAAVAATGGAVAATGMIASSYVDNFILKTFADVASLCLPVAGTGAVLSRILPKNGRGSGRALLAGLAGFAAVITGRCALEQREAERYAQPVQVAPANWPAAFPMPANH